MKIVRMFLIALIVFVMGYSGVNAMILKPSGDAVAKKGDLITIYLTLEKNDDEKQVSAVDGIISFDDKVISYVNSTLIMEKWTEFMLINNNQVFSYANLSYDNLVINNRQNIIEVVFKINENAPSGNTEILLSNVSATDENGEGLEIDSGSHIVRVLSDINALSDIKIKGVDVEFEENTYEYNLSIDNASTEIEVIKKDDNSIVTGDVGTLNLNYGLNKFSINVKSESGLTRTYTLNITRPDNRSKENTLSDLKLSAGTIKFNKDTLNYRLTVENDVTAISLEASLTDSKSSYVEGFGPRIIDLDVGTNKIEIKIKAENEEIKIYTINVIRGEKEDHINDDIPDNNQTGNPWFIVICLLTLSSLVVMICYFKRKKNN